MEWNKAKWEGLIRHVLTGVGPIMAYLGWVDEATWATIAGAVLAVVGVAWSWFAPEKKA